jgi:hypothetical protein
VSNNKNLAIPAEATWSAEYDTKRAQGTSIKKQPGGGQQKTGRLTMEIAIKLTTWKSLIDNLYLDNATHDLKGEEEAYKFAYRNALGGILVFTRFFNLETKSFTQDPCLMFIALTSTSLDSPALTVAP